MRRLCRYKYDFRICGKESIRRIKAYFFCDASYQRCQTDRIAPAATLSQKRLDGTHHNTESIKMSESIFMPSYSVFLDEIRVRRMDMLKRPPYMYSAFDISQGKRSCFIYLLGHNMNANLHRTQPQIGFCR